jgi:hypothetical protein
MFTNNLALAFGLVCVVRNFPRSLIGADALIKNSLKMFKNTNNRDPAVTP